jgi:hypothetical protein
LDDEIDKLETLLEEESKRSSSPPLLALFTENPSNPLLRSANLPRLRALADKYDFLLVVDETIGNFVNVEVLPYADIVVSSLTKIFSGDANVMGGRCVYCLTRRTSLKKVPVLFSIQKARIIESSKIISLPHTKMHTSVKMLSIWSVTRGTSGDESALLTTIRRLYATS